MAILPIERDGGELHNVRKNLEEFLAITEDKFITEFLAWNYICSEGAQRI